MNDRLTATMDSGLRELRRVSGLPLAFGGRVAADRSSFTISMLRGLRTTSLERLRVTTGQGVGGRVLAERRAVRVDDYFNERSITHLYDRACAPEQLHTVLGLPILGGAGTDFVLYLAARTPVALTDRTLAEVERIARGIGRELRIEAEVERRLAERAPESPVTEPVPEAALVEELLSIAAQSADGRTRARLEELVAARSAHTAPSGPDLINPLTRRERQVLQLAERGLSNAAVAAECGLLVNTVKAYMKSAIAKTLTQNRIQAALTARRNGWLETP